MLAQCLHFKQFCEPLLELKTGFDCQMDKLQFDAKSKIIFKILQFVRLSKRFYFVSITDAYFVSITDAQSVDAKRSRDELR